MIFNLPILSESQPKKTKNGDPSARAEEIIIAAVRKSIFRVLCMNIAVENCAVCHTTAEPETTTKARIINFKFSFLARVSESGVKDVLLRFFNVVNSAVSVNFHLIIRAMMRRNAAPRKGTLHPQL